MFKIEDFKKLTVKWPVEFEVDAANGDKKKGVYTATFRILSDETIQKMAIEGDSELILRILDDWDGVVDEEGAHVDCNEQSILSLCAFTFFRVQTLQAYYECVSSCARKN